MKVSVTIIGVLQRVDLETQSSTNMIELLLPNGYRFTCEVMERDVTQVINSSVGIDDAPADTPEMPSILQDELSVFGGEAFAPPAAEITNVRRPAHVREHAYVTKTGVTTKVRTVAKDEAGNPILGELARDAGNFGNVDEDGVPAA